MRRTTEDKILERITVKGKKVPLNPSEIFSKLSSKLSCLYDESVLILIYTEKMLFFLIELLNEKITSCHHYKIDIPVVYSPRFGHGEYNDVMPLGTTASLNIHGELAT